MKMNENQLTVDLRQRFEYAQTPALHYYFSSSFPPSFPPAALDTAPSKLTPVFLSITNRQSDIRDHFMTAQCNSDANDHKHSHLFPVFKPSS